MKNDSKSQKPDATKKEVDAESAFILCLHTVEATISGGNASQLGPLSHQPAPQLFLPPHLYAIPYLFHVLSFRPCLNSRVMSRTQATSRNQLYVTRSEKREHWRNKL